MSFGTSLSRGRDATALRATTRTTAPSMLKMNYNNDITEYDQRDQVRQGRWQLRL
jgi:hypothetical protein